MASRTRVVDLGAMSREDLIAIAKKQATQLREKSTRINTMEELIEGLTNAHQHTDVSSQLSSVHRNHRSVTPRSPSIEDVFRDDRNGSSNNRSNNNNNDNVLDQLYNNTPSASPPAGSQGYARQGADDDDIVRIRILSLEEALAASEQRLSEKTQAHVTLETQVADWKKRVMQTSMADQAKIEELQARLAAAEASIASEQQKAMTSAAELSSSHSQPQLSASAADIPPDVLEAAVQEKLQTWKERVKVAMQKEYDRAEALSAELDALRQEVAAAATATEAAAAVAPSAEESSAVVASLRQELDALRARSAERDVQRAEEAAVAEAAARQADESAQSQLALAQQRVAQLQGELAVARTEREAAAQAAATDAEVVASLLQQVTELRAAATAAPPPMQGTVEGTQTLEIPSDVLDAAVKEKLTLLTEQATRDLHDRIATLEQALATTTDEREEILQHLEQLEGAHDEQVRLAQEHHITESEHIAIISDLRQEVSGLQAQLEQATQMCHEADEDWQKMVESLNAQQEAALLQLEAEKREVQLALEHALHNNNNNSSAEEDADEASAEVETAAAPPTLQGGSEVVSGGEAVAAPSEEEKAPVSPVTPVTPVTPSAATVAELEALRAELGSGLRREQALVAQLYDAQAYIGNIQRDLEEAERNRVQLLEEMRERGGSCEQCQVLQEQLDAASQQQAETVESMSLAQVHNASLATQLHQIQSYYHAMGTVMEEDIVRQYLVTAEMDAMIKILEAHGREAVRAVSAELDEVRQSLAAISSQLNDVQQEKDAVMLAAQADSDSLRAQLQEIQSGRSADTLVAAEQGKALLVETEQALTSAQERISQLQGELDKALHEPCPHCAALETKMSEWKKKVRQVISDADAERAVLQESLAALQHQLDEAALTAADRAGDHDKAMEDLREKLVAADAEGSRLATALASAAAEMAALQEAAAATVSEVAAVNTESSGAEVTDMSAFVLEMSERMSALQKASEEWTMEKAHMSAAIKELEGFRSSVLAAARAARRDGGNSDTCDQAT